MYLDLHTHSVSSDDSRATVEQYVKWVGVLTGLLEAGRVDELVEVLLEHYYDPLYEHSEKGREHAVEIDSTDPAACAAEVAAWVEQAKE